MDKKLKGSTTERLLGPQTPSPSGSGSPSLQPISFSGDVMSTKRRQWSSGPPNLGSMRYRTGRLSSPIPPPSPSASSTVSSKDIFTNGYFDDITPVPVGQLSQSDVHLNPIWPDIVINLIKRSTSDPHRGDPSTIHRVPHEFHKAIDHDPYSPKVVCLGPYFHSYQHSPSLKHMQDNKWRCLQSLIYRYDGLSEPGKASILTQRCMILMKAVDAQLRQSYSDSISLDNEELAEMMVLDGCFLLHLLLRHAPLGMMKEEILQELEQVQNHSSISSNRPWVWNMVMYDLLLVENQIPFFVVEILFDIFKTKHDEKIDLLACMLNLFSEIQPHGIEDISLLRNRRFHIHHFLHAYYLSLIPQVNQKEYSTSVSLPLLSPPIESTIGLSKLLEEGIRIKNNKKSISFMDISFKNGVMTIPTLQIHDYSIRLFHNIIAYEQCEHDNTGYVSNYVAFMQGLIDVSNDMKTMNSNGIIVDRRSTDQLENGFFRNFGDLISISSEDGYMRGLYWELNRYRGSRNDNRWISCMHRHFGSSTVVFSTGALVMLLLVTNILLAYFSVFSCGKSKK